LLGRRLVRATVIVAQRNSSGATERLRQALHGWASEMAEASQTSAVVPRESPFALALISGARRRTLVAVTDTAVCDNPRTVLDAVETLSATKCRGVSHSLCDALAKVRAWLEEQHGRDLAQLALESPSAVHATILRMLQDRRVEATRSERATLGLRIERVRRAVLAARGTGAEKALERFRNPPLDLDGLERVLSSRALADRGPTYPRRLEAILYFDGSHDGCVSACVADETGE
jgi:hypothetical protein